MSHVLHELASKFPNKTAKIRQLKMNNAHFSKMFDEYHEVNRRVHRIDAEGNNRSQEMIENLKKKRILLLDKLTQMLD